MKKVKIMLTAITVFAVVGGALAFKAKNFTSSLFCTSQATPNACQAQVDNISLKPVGGEPSLGSSSCTSEFDGDCQLRPTYADQ
jgi:hypothetical protein